MSWHSLTVKTLTTNCLECGLNNGNNNNNKIVRCLCSVIFRYLEPATAFNFINGTSRKRENKLLIDLIDLTSFPGGDGRYGRGYREF